MPSTGNIPCVEEVLAGDSVGKLEPGTVGTFVEDISENSLKAEKVRRPRLLKDEEVFKAGINLSLSRGCCYAAWCWLSSLASCSMLIGSQLNIGTVSRGETVKTVKGMCFNTTTK